MDVRNLDKGRVFIRFATRALILGLKRIPGVGMVLNQTDAIGKAAEVEKLVEEAAEAQRAAIDAQGR